MAVQLPPVALVTGASRGVGKGVALALAELGSTVYVTGRDASGSESSLPGTLEATVEEIDARGGRGVALICDHRDDGQIRHLFEQIEAREGRLDILVNNVFCVPETLQEVRPFWEKPMSYWDDMIDLGLRSHYLASCCAAPIMVRQKSGLIVNISSFGARCYIHTPVYGIGKAGTDKMAHDMAKELREHKVAALSLWLGIVKTERTEAIMSQAPDAYEALAAGIESPEYAGRVIAALAASDSLMERSGKTWVAAELGAELKVCDVDGNFPTSYASMLGHPAQPSDAMIR